MNSYIKLVIAALLPVIISVFFYLLDEKSRLKDMKYWWKQSIYGVTFGLLAIIGTEWSIPIEGAILNCRDTAVITAGLFFGAPAGVIAGVIGGIERWIAVAWGVGYFTKVACSLSTILAGLIAALFRKYIFENKKPGWLLSAAMGVILEVLHLTLVFLLNVDRMDETIEIIRMCAKPVIITNAISVMLSAVALSLLAGKKSEFSDIRIRKRQEPISQSIQRWLLLTIICAFIAISYIAFFALNRIALDQSDKLLTIALNETEAEIRDASNGNLPNITKNRHVGEEGFILIIDEQFNVVSSPVDVKLSTVREYIDGDQRVDQSFTVEEDGVRYLAQRRFVEGYRIVSLLPEYEVVHMRNVAMYINCFLVVLVFAILFVMIFIVIKLLVVDQIKGMNRSLTKISNGDLEEVVNVRNNQEFSLLSDDINRTVDTLKKYIDEAAKRIDQELEVAREIQISTLPNVFPAFPNRKDLDIFASMNPAKEVGGDFYDFYMTNDHILNLLVADVSGKGIPAAMFMMRAKNELKRLTDAGWKLSEIFTKGNTNLCEGNDARMFLTAWQGSVDLNTGVIQFVNAGHNLPFIRRNNGEFEFLKYESDFVLAGIPGMKYNTQETRLYPGDILYLYTDGVTEASNISEEFYGNDRLQDALNHAEFQNMQELCMWVKADLDTFAKGAPQFDDITMLAFQYNGS